MRDARNKQTKDKAKQVPASHQPTMVDMMDDIPDITFEFEKGMVARQMQDYTGGDGSVQSIDDIPQKPGEICKFYLKGSCMKGNNCQFRHSRNERAVVCKHWLRGLCKKGDLCEFLHEYDLEKMPECYFFSKFGMLSNSLFKLILINKLSLNINVHFIWGTGGQRSNIAMRS